MLERLHQAWLLRLRDEWKRINTAKLAGKLIMPVLIIDRGEARLGRWQARGRLLGLSEQHIWNQPWEEVLDTLRHEMAHQYASEVLGLRDEDEPHGPAFQQACKLLGIDPRATARETTHQPAEADRILARVRKLLALAESSNVHEAEAAMAAANTLLLKYNLELGAQDVHPGYAWRRIGPSAAALSLERKLVASILTQYFFVESIWASVYNARMDRMERQLELLGTATNLELASYVHDFLLNSADALWSRAHRGLTARSRTTRREFVAGVLMGFQDKLKEERRGHAERGLVWRGDADLDRYFQQRYPRVQALGGGGVRLSSAHQAGREEGRKLKIHKGIHETGGAGRLLGRG